MNMLSILIVVVIMRMMSTSQENYNEPGDTKPGNSTLAEKINPVLPQNKVDELKHRIRHIGLWLRHHKFFETDQRFAFRGEDQKAYFYQRFPEPPLRRLVDSVAKSCRLGVNYCIDEIWSKYINTPGYRLQYQSSAGYREKLKQRWANASRKTEKEIQYEPFESKLQKFQYRTTASYYMCYYTLQRSHLLEYFILPRCIYNRITINAETATSKYDIASPDYRTDDSINFSCAFHSFCPDVCCGKISGPVTGKEKCQLFAGNPCYEVGDGRCEPDPKNNANFEAIIRNRINVTCDCDTEKKGYRWSSIFGQCVDRNECREAFYAGRCSGEGQTCQNTIGSFMCTCRWGYKKSNNSDDCVVDENLGYIAVDMEKKMRAPENSLLDFKVKNVGKKVPWKLKLVYNINYYAALILNHTLHFYNLAGFEEWMQSGTSTLSTLSSLPALVLSLVTLASVV